jgi:predicted short-subunit dehydrogenase-like oxidoreductase (DUF2520 family)
MEIQTVNIIGSGKVAKNLGIALQEKGITVSCICSKTKEHADALALELNASSTTNLSSMPIADLYLLCVPDQVILSIVAMLPNGVNIAFTAGAVELPLVNGSSKIGVFYPLQTFSENRKANVFEIPFYVESEDQYFQQNLFDLAWKLSKNVHLSTYKQRLHTHIAAVFTNNFTNHMLVLAEQHCLENGVDFKDLQPLLKETMNKAIDLGPRKSQTGPAVRNDQTTLISHEAKLSGKSKEIYSLVSQSIQQNKLID